MTTRTIREEWQRGDGYQGLAQSFANQDLSETSLVNFAQMAVLQHKWFHHFTNIKGLKQILQNKQWKLSSAFTCNDLQEFNVKGSPIEWKKIYSMSFSHGDEDCMGMWKSYGGKYDKQKVRISIPVVALKEWKESLIASHSSIKSHISKNSTQGLLPNYSVSFHDILYASGYQFDIHSTLHWDGLERRLTDNGRVLNPSLYSELTGYIKNTAWEYEQESRIMVKIEENESPEYLLADIPEKTIKQFKIVVCPYYNPIDFKTYLTNELAECDNSLTHSILEQAELSYFNGKIIKI